MRTRSRSRSDVGLSTSRREGDYRYGGANGRSPSSERGGSRYPSGGVRTQYNPPLMNQIRGEGHAD